MTGRTTAAIALALLMTAACNGPAPPSPAAPAAPAGPAWFEEVGRQNGLVFDHLSGHRDRPLFPEIIGGGVALFDMDGDGDLDAYLAQSGSLTDGADVATANRLFANAGGGRFEDVSEGSGAADTGYAMGVAAGDFDNDGDVDLYVTNYGPNVLLRNDGSGKFTDVTADAGVGDPSWSTSAAFLDYDRDGDLDLFSVNYVNWAVRTEQDCYNTAGLLDYCLPTNYNAPAMDRLYRNNGDGTFEDVTEATGVRGAFGNGLGIVAADFNSDGWVDIFVANDTMMNQLWISQAGEGFRDESLLRGCALDEHGLAKAGMGVAAEDVDNDGDQDLIVVNLQGQTDSVFRNDDGFFVDQTGTVGLGASSRWFTRFGIGLIDFDNDGNLDFFEANGRVMMAGEPNAEDRYAEPNMVFRGSDQGRFQELTPVGGTATPLVATSRAAAFGDLDGDGGIDVVVVNRDGPAHLLRNVVPDRGGWARFRLVESHGRDALGATVTMRVGGRTVTRVARAAYSYCASSDPRVHVGLGRSTRVEDVRVLWPDGQTESFGGFDAGQEILLRQGSSGN